MHPPGQSIVVFRPDKATSNEHDETFMGDLKSYDEVHKWIQKLLTEHLMVVHFFLFEDFVLTLKILCFLQLNIWTAEKCVPLVREITFENAEELTEEGLPFLILFHKADDTESIKKYKDVINKELIDEKRKIQQSSSNIATGTFYFL